MYDFFCLFIYKKYANRLLVRLIGRKGWGIVV